MGECYNCGAYIPRGEGYRRQVYTGSSARIYVGKLRGGSYGQSYGPRTVCATCAKISDKSSEGTIFRGILCLAGWALCIKYGLAIVNHEYDIQKPASGFLMLFLLVGGPVWIIDALINKARRQKIIEDVISEETRYRPSVQQQEEVNNNPFDINSKRLALRKGEAVEDWSNRIAAYANQVEPDVADGIFDISEAILGMGKYLQPKEGETIKAYVHRSQKRIEYLKNQIFDADDVSSGIQKGETFDEWVMRVASNIDAEDIEETLGNLSKYVKPKISEPFNEYIERATVQIKSFDTSIDLDGVSSSIGNNESAREWLERVAPLFLKIEEGDSLEEAIDMLVAIARNARPLKNESARAWLKRVEPLIEEANRDED